MSSKRSIRVVKRKQRQLLSERQDSLACGLKTEREARRAMLKTITSWIEEQREIKKQSSRCLVLLEEPGD